MVKTTLVRITMLLFFVALFTTVQASGNDTLNISVLVTNGDQRSTMSSLLSAFQKQNPNITTELTMLPDKEYKAALKTWLDSGKGPDIINWQAGERLYQYVRQNKVKSIDSVWKKHHLADKFTRGSISAVSWKSEVYGIPISYYQWGLYYRKSLFKQFDLTPPTNWSEFIHVCKTLKQNNITPITIGTKYKWPSAAWFDYLNLRINGLEFHSQLLRGEISFQDPKVITVFQYWQQLLVPNYFVEQGENWKWDEAMPFLYHRLAGMTLVGNFFAGHMPELLKDDFGFFRFPIINEEIPTFEEAPLDAFIVPHYTQITPSVERFLLFLSENKFQEPLNNQLGMISPNVNVAGSNDYFSLIGKKTLSEAAGLSQFFDRDTNDGMSAEAINIFTNFIADHNIDKAIDGLERARKKHLLK
jgi:multiple sugar transport system substrate-binding protein